MDEMKLETMDIPADEAKYYVAINCKCGSAITFAGKHDLNVTKECFYCNRKWKMIDVYGVQVIEHE